MRMDFASWRFASSASSLDANCFPFGCACWLEESAVSSCTLSEFLTLLPVAAAVEEAAATVPPPDRGGVLLGTPGWGIEKLGVPVVGGMGCSLSSNPEMDPP